MTTVEATKELFVETAQKCTSATVEGITRDTLDAAFSNALDALNESAFQNDYDVPNDRVIFLLLNYDEESQQADGIGVVTCKWRIQIKNYKEKKSDPKHETKLTISSWSVLYTDPELIEKHYNT